MKKNPVIWAYNPYAELSVAPDLTLKFIRGLVPQTCPVELTYVMSPKSVQWDRKLSTAWLNKLKPAVYEAMAGVKLKDIDQQNILVNSKGQISHDVQHLCDYAKRYKAKFIVLSTHARKGVSRWFMGSFTEAAITKSKVPLLVLNPQAKLPEQVTKVLVATDLSKASIRGINLLVPFLKSLKVKVHIVNKMMDPIDPVLQSGVVAFGGGWVGIQSFLEDDLRLRKDQLTKLAKQLASQGLPVSTQVVERTGAVADVILQTAHSEKCQMIVTVSSSSAAEAFFGGSTTRAIARSTDLPLFIYPGR